MQRKNTSITAAAFIALAVIACDASPKRKRAPAPSPSTALPSASASATPTVAAGVHYTLRHTGGVDPATKAPMVIAVHGLGDAPERFAGLLSAVSEPARLIFPRGLSPHGRGYSWFGIGRERAAGIRSAADRLASMVAALVKRYPTRGKPIVTGFSQGGMLSFALGARHGDAFAAAFPLSGSLPAELIPSEAPAGAPPIVAFHGDADPVVGIDEARTTTQLLRERGYDAQLVEYPGVRHTVSAAMHRALMRHLREALAKTDAP